MKPSIEDYLAAHPGWQPVSEIAKNTGLPWAGNTLARLVRLGKVRRDYVPSRSGLEMRAYYRLAGKAGLVSAAGDDGE